MNIGVRHILFVTFILLAVFVGNNLLANDVVDRQVVDIQDLPNLSELDTVLMVAEKENRDVIFVFSAKWCGPCQNFKQKTIAPLLPKMRSQYILYIVDVDDYKNHPMVKHLKEKKIIEMIPAYIMITNRGTEMVTYGYGDRNPEQFVQWMSNGIRAWKEYKSKVQK